MEPTSTPAVSLVHVFEKSGLGKAPFICIGMSEMVGPIRLPNGMEIGSAGQPMGSCAYCGTGIRDCFHIRSADGKTFMVGCDCVHKTGDKGLRRTVDAKVAGLKRARDEKRIAAAWAALTPAVWDALSKLPHPHPACRDRLNLADSVDFNFRNGGRTGKLKAARAIEKVLSDMAQTPT